MRAVLIAVLVCLVTAGGVGQTVSDDSFVAAPGGTPSEPDRDFHNFNQRIKPTAGAVLFDRPDGKPTVELPDSDAVLAIGASVDGKWWKVITLTGQVGYLRTSRGMVQSSGGGAATLALTEPSLEKEFQDALTRGFQPVDVFVILPPTVPIHGLVAGQQVFGTGSVAPVTVTGRSKDGKWLRLVVPNRGAGYIQAKYVLG